MLQLLSSLKNLVKKRSVCIDDIHFRLHYQLTASMLFAFSVLLTGRQYLGDPIDCIVDEVPADLMDTYCWIHSTFTIPQVPDKSHIYPGVSTFVEGEDKVKDHKYYQWVCLFLYLQAIFFYIPHYLWKSCEGRRMKMLLGSIDEPKKQMVKFMDEEEEKLQSLWKDKQERVDRLVEYFSERYQKQGPYLMKFLFCEILNFVNVIGQIFFMDYFLDGEFLNFGLDVINFTNMDPDQRVDPMSSVFPKVAKCTFKKYGASGTLQKFDGFCVLPFNILNEKIIVFLWFWFVTLAVLSAGFLIYKVSVLYSAQKRRQCLRSKYILSSDTGDASIKLIVDKLSVGEWFIFNQLGKNEDALVYAGVIHELSKAFGQKG